MKKQKETLFVSFSGGRTSGYMCWWLLNNKSEEYEFIFVFANTGLEDERTLEFVNRVDQEWLTPAGSPLVWLEAVTSMEFGVGQTYKIVDFHTAARNGEPFEEFIKFSGIPNKSYNQCSERLKTFPMERYRQSLGFSRKHPTCVGIRADEIDRMSTKAKENGLIYPLIKWTQTTKAEVIHWWAEQPFDLDLPEHYGNCVTCWKKSDRKLLTIAKNDPERFDFMDRMERQYKWVRCLTEQPRLFFRGHRSAQDIIATSKKPFVEFQDHKPELQITMFDPIDIENDCGSGCEIQ